MAYTWETKGGVWLEDEGSGCFAPAGLGREAQQRAADLAQLLGASLPARCAHAPLYPQGFAFCPACGAPLAVAAAPPRPPWWGAGGAPGLPKTVPHGLPLTTLPLSDGLGRQRPAARPELTLPAAPNAVCVFAAANFGYAAQRLLALAYTRNVLQYWDPHARLWHALTAADGAASLAFQGAEYGWLPAGAEARRGEVALVPGAQGLLRLLIDPLDLCYRTELLCEFAPVAAPGAVRGGIACLVLRQERVHLWSARADGAAAQAFDCAGPVPAAGWSRPLGYDDRLLWLHAQGQLVWQPGQAPQWLPWPRGWTARLAFGGALQGRDGRLWLIGHDGHGYALRELGVAAAQVEPVDGARLGFGTLLFRRGHPVHGEPWEAEQIEEHGDAGSLVLPLLQEWNGVRSKPSGLVLRMLDYQDQAEHALAGAPVAKTLVQWIGEQGNVVLDELFRLKRPGACQPFVYDDCLWLHHPDWNELRGWRLGLAPS